MKCIVIFWFLDSKVAGERYVYKFVCDPEALFSMAFPDNQRPVLKTDLERQINEEDTVPLSHFDENMAYIQEGGYCNPHPYNEGYVYWKLLPAVRKQNDKLSDLSLISFSHSPDKREHFMDRGWWQCVNLQTYWCSYVRCSFGVFCCYWRGWGVSACRFLTAKDSWGQMASLRTDVLNYLDRLESGAREWNNPNLFYHWNSWIVCGELCYFRTFSQHLFSLPWCQTE